MSSLNYSKSGQPFVSGTFATVQPGGTGSPYGGMEAGPGALANLTRMGALGLGAWVDLYSLQTADITNLGVIWGQADTITGMKVAPIFDDAVLSQSDSVSTMVPIFTAAIVSYLTTYAPAHTSSLKSSDGRYVVVVYGGTMAPSGWQQVIAAVTADGHSAFFVAPIPGNIQDYDGSEWLASYAGAFANNADAYVEFFPIPAAYVDAVKSLVAPSQLIFSAMALYPAHPEILDWPADGGVRFQAQAVQAGGLVPSAAVVRTWNEVTNGDEDGIAGTLALEAIAQQIAAVVSLSLVAPAAATGMGNILARQFAADVAANGLPVSINGLTYYAMIEVPPRRNMDEVLETAGLNEANADVRRMWLPAAGFAAPSQYPVETATISFVESGEVLTFRILTKHVNVVANVDISVWMMIYREPQDTSATVAPEGQTGAGSPKVYVVPVNPN